MKRSPLKRKSAIRRVKAPKAIARAESNGQTLTKSQVQKLADMEWAILVKLHAHGLCEWCGKPAQDAHHMVSRRHAATRHLPENGVALCKGCHLHFHNKESLTGWELFQTSRPESYRLVGLLRRAECKRSVHGLREILADLREKIAAFKGAA